MKLTSYLFVALLSLASVAHADNIWTVNTGLVRENDGISNYKVVAVDWQFSKWFALDAGDIFGGNPDLYHGDYSTKWIGPSLVLREDPQTCDICMRDSVGYIRLSRKTHNLTSPYQFYITFGVGIGSYSISYSHISNANTGGANYGEDLIIFGTTFGATY